MRVRLTTDRVGPFGVQRTGEVVDLPDKEAKALIGSGQAEPIEEREVAMTAPQRETGMKRRRGRRRR